MTAQAVPAPLCPLASRYAYHVVASAACMPARCMGVYRRIAVIEVDHHERPFDYLPERIVEGYGLRIVQAWERLNVGVTEACAFGVAKAEAGQVAQDMRAQRRTEALADTGLRAVAAA